MNEVAFAHKLSKHSGAIERLIVRLLEQGLSLEQIKTSLESHDHAFSQAGTKISELENAIIALSERGKLAQNEANEALKGTELRSRHHANELSQELLTAVSAKIEAESEARMGTEVRVNALSDENSRAHRLIAGIQDDVSGVKALASDGLRIAREAASRPVVQLSSDGGTTALVDSFQGNWKKDKAYKRGDTFTFRGGFFLVLKDCKGLLPDVKSQTGPDRSYACLAAPGAPGQNTGGGSGGGGSGSVTSITAGTGLTGGTITSTGTIAVDGSVVAFRSALATVAFSGAYSDLSGKPTIPTMPVGADPTALVGLAVVAGAATTYMRSDAAPPIDQSITPTWTGSHQFNAALPLTVGNTGTGGLRVFNTADQTTNTEYGEFTWTGNILNVGTINTGTGSRRAARFGILTGGADQYITIQKTTPYYQYNGSAITGTTTMSYVAITPNWNTSSTSANTDLLVNRTETGVGSGLQRLLDLQVGSVSRFAVDNIGNALVSNTATSGIQIFNTSDQVTNFEKLSLVWISNTATISTTFGGTGVNRGITFSTNGASLGISATQPTLTMSGTNTSTTGAYVATVTYSAVTSTQKGLSLNSTYNQVTSTAGSTDIFVNRTETSLGSSTHSFIDCQVSAVSRFTVSNIGNVFISNTATTGLQIYNTVVGSNTERIQLYWTGNTATLAMINAGSGTTRNIQITNNQVSQTFRTGGSTAGMMQFAVPSVSTVNNVGYAFTGIASTAASGLNLGIQLTTTYNQNSGTSTAANTDFAITRTQTSLGSGAQLFCDFRVTTTSMFSVSNVGNVVAAGSITTAAPAGSTAQPFKVGSYTASIPVISGQVAIDIGGTVYKFAVST